MYTHACKYSHPIPLSVAIYMHPYCFLAAVTVTVGAVCCRRFYHILYGVMSDFCVHILDSLGLFVDSLSLSLCLVYPVRCFCYSFHFRSEFA